MGEIETKTDPSQWRHIPGKVNVADNVSRGHGRLSNGMEFLQLPEEFWPQETLKPVSEEDMERRHADESRLRSKEG